MSKNDVIILDSILAQRKVPGLSNEENFELFAYEQILKDYDLSYDELLNGKIGDKNGIGLFNFVNDELIEEDSDLNDIKKPNMATFLIIAKTSYSEIYVDNITKIIRDIFDFDNDKSDIKIFRDTYLKLVPRELMIHIVFATKEIISSKTILQKVEDLKKIIAEYMPNINIISRMVNPGELIILAHKEKSYTLQLKFDKLMSDGDNYFVLSTLTDYGKFIIDEERNLRLYIFDANVRDFQKTSEVNKGILKTLNSKDNADFWWYNNGITILAKNPSISGDTISLDDVQIVNGLQTTHVIYKYLRTVNGIDKRKICIKILTTEDSEIRDNIIKFANSQNQIPKTSLRANDNVQRNIESYLLNQDWFYDRRKNYYKNMRKPIDKIISIGYLAQAIMSMVYREPNRARKKPTSLTKYDKDYDLMFGLSNFKVFLFCIENMKKIDSFLRSSEYAEQYKTNLKWHLATLTMVKTLGKRDYMITDIESILDTRLENRFIDDTMSEIVNLADTYLKYHNVIFRTMSTNRDFVNYILENVKIDKPNIDVSIDANMSKDIDTSNDTKLEKAQDNLLDCKNI